MQASRRAASSLSLRSFCPPLRTLGCLACLCILVSGCSDSKNDNKDLAIDRTVVASSQYPTAVDPSRVGLYPALTKSGAGYFYDDVLEYRVWIHPQEAGGDYYRAFASYELALRFSKSTPGAEAPLVLIRQNEWLDEPEKGEFVRRSDERITEWQTVWLSQDTKRREDSIERFLREKAGEKK